jgi:hypothetical protein
MIVSAVSTGSWSDRDQQSTNRTNDYLTALSLGQCSKLWYVEADPADPMLDRDGFGVSLFLISMSVGVLHGIAVNACFAVGLASTLALLSVPATVGRIVLQARFPKAGRTLRTAAGGGLALAGVLAVLFWRRILTAPTDELPPLSGPLKWGVATFDQLGDALAVVSVRQGLALIILFGGIGLALERWNAWRREAPVEEQ